MLVSLLYPCTAFPICTTIMTHYSYWILNHRDWPCDSVFSMCTVRCSMIVCHVSTCWKCNSPAQASGERCPRTRSLSKKMAAASPWSTSLHACNDGCQRWNLCIISEASEWAKRRVHRCETASIRPITKTHLTQKQMIIIIIMSWFFFLPKKLLWNGCLRGKHVIRICQT